MKASRRTARKAAPRSAHAHAVRRRSRSVSAVRQVELPLPGALTKESFPRGGSIALVDVEGKRLRLRFLRPSLVGGEGAALTASEDAALTKGGVEPASADEVRLVEAAAAAAYHQVRATSLSVEEAAHHLGVNTSRVRQRLAERSLFGLKDGHAWLLPAFQFRADGLVPGVDEVVRSLPADIGTLAVARWFASPNPDLCTRDDEERPLTPLQWLLEGNRPEAAAVLAAAL
jgi:hypothetical protein